MGICPSIKRVALYSVVIFSGRIFCSLCQWFSSKLFSMLDLNYTVCHLKHFIFARKHSLIFMFEIGCEKIVYFTVHNSGAIGAYQNVIADIGLTIAKD